MVLEVCRHREIFEVIHYSQTKEAFSCWLNKLPQNLHKNWGMARYGFNKPVITTRKGEMV
jgi:hypothetical protein